MGLRPGPSGLLIAVDVRNDRWQLHGCVGGPHPLPNTKASNNFREALDRSEQSLAAELAEAQAARREQ